MIKKGHTPNPSREGKHGVYLSGVVRALSPFGRVRECFVFLVSFVQLSPLERGRGVFFKLAIK